MTISFHPIPFAQPSGPPPGGPEYEATPDGDFELRHDEDRQVQEAVRRSRQVRE